jgi:peptidoglycan/xylan/chitin deacetylase (PgdA/CDA1 family)
MKNGCPEPMISNFLFHRVSPERDPLWDPMDVGLFERSIKYISKHFEVVQLEELMQDVDKVDSKHKFATILFDDGYKDNIEYAAPVLDTYKVKASFYVVTDCIDHSRPTWTHVLDYSFQHTSKIDIDLGFGFLPSPLRVNKFQNRESRIDYARKLKPALKEISHHERQRVLERISQAFDDIALPRLMMGWSDLHELKSAGHYIGSHTVSHPMLGTMADPEDIRGEIFNSAKQIKKQLGHFPVSISYPVGSYNDVAIAISKEAGHQLGLAVKQRAYNPKKDSLFEIPRIELYNESWLKTRLRIDGIIERVSRILAR